MQVRKIKAADHPQPINWLTAPAVPLKVLNGEISVGTVVEGPNGQQTYILDNETPPTKRQNLLGHHGWDLPGNGTFADTGNGAQLEG